MPSGKGKKCPNCGAPKLQPYKKGYRCSGCYHRGWKDFALPRPDGGKGAYCYECKKHTLHKIEASTHKGARLVVKHCNGCGATLYRLMTKRVQMK